MLWPPEPRLLTFIRVRRYHVVAKRTAGAFQVQLPCRFYLCDLGT